MKRKLIRISIILFLLVLPLLVWRAYLAHLINQQLEQIRAAGLPTNGEELNRWYPAVQENQNAALVLTQAFALLKTINTVSDQHVTEISKLKEKLPRRADRLTAEQVKLIRWYVETNLPALKKADEALKLPACRFPIDCTRLMNTELPHLAHLASVGHLNQCAAALAELDGRVKSATENIVTILALTHTLDCEPCLISQFVKLRLIEMAFNALESRANASPFDLVEIANLVKSFTNTRVEGAVVRGLIGDRALTIPYFRLSRAEYNRIRAPKSEAESEKNSALPCDGPAILNLIGYYKLDFHTYLLGMNRAIELISNAPPENLRASGFFARVGEASNKRQRPLSAQISQAFFAYAGVPRREVKGIACQRLALTALAVETFRNAKSRVPEKLEDLIPEYLKDLPEDPFTGLGIHYRPKKNGYVIYSVGPDQSDDGGLEKADKKESKDKKSYDITFTVER